MLAVKRALETMKENYITAEEYRKICVGNGVNSCPVRSDDRGGCRRIAAAGDVAA